MNWDTILSISLKILAVLALVVLNGFFVAAELALVRIRAIRNLAALVAKGNRRAKTARHIVAHIDTYIGATQFGITMASLGLGVAVEPVFNALLNPLFDLLGVIASERLASRHRHRRRIFRELLPADRGGRTGAESNCHPPHAADGVVDGQPAGLVLPAGVSVHLGAAQFIAVDRETAGHRRG